MLMSIKFLDIYNILILSYYFQLFVSTLFYIFFMFGVLFIRNGHNDIYDGITELQIVFSTPVIFYQLQLKLISYIYYSISLMYILF